MKLRKGDHVVMLCARQEEYGGSYPIIHWTSLAPIIGIFERYCPDGLEIQYDGATGYYDRKEILNPQDPKDFRKLNSKFVKIEGLMLRLRKQRKTK